MTVDVIIRKVHKIGLANVNLLVVHYLFYRLYYVFQKIKYINPGKKSKNNEN